MSTGGFNQRDVSPCTDFEKNQKNISANVMRSATAARAGAGHAYIHMTIHRLKKGQFAQNRKLTRTGLK